MTAPESAFILDLTSTNGRALMQLPPAEGEIELRQWTTWLRIRSDITGFVPPMINPEDDELTGFVPPAFEDDGLALMTTVRNNEDLSGASIGLFHARLDTQELEQLRATIEQTAWVDLPRPAGGDFNAPTLCIAYRRGTKLIRRSFNARSSNFIEAIAPVWNLLDKVLVRTRKSAASSWMLELELEAAPEDPLALSVNLRLRARGIGHVALTDPRMGVAVGEPPRLRVWVGEQDIDNPDARADNRVDLAIPTPLPDEPRTLVLRPNGRFELSLPWRAPRPGRYLVHASWEDYRGPIDPVAGQTPFMPLPTVGPSSLGSGPYPIRGAVFATRVIDLG
jgi:hypothetical protein